MSAIIIRFPTRVVIDIPNRIEQRSAVAALAQSVVAR
jgi:hypothetical protein